MLACSLLATLSCAKANNWALNTSRDLISINALFKRNAPVSIEKQSTQYTHWYQHGYYKALSEARKNKSFAGYLAILNEYVYGLDVPTMAVLTSVSTNVSHIQWPGFTVGIKAGTVKVISSPCHSYDPKHCPAVDAVVQSCDGQPVNEWINKNIIPFMTVKQRYIDFQNLFVPNLLINKGNPLREYPQQCTIGKTVYPLEWHDFRRGLSTYLHYVSLARDLPVQSLVLTQDVYAGLFPYDFSIHHFGKQNVWIKIPSFQESYRHHLQVIKDSVSQYRNTKVLVFDLRGNLGGNVDFGQDILKALYGKDFLQSIGKSLPLNQMWHAKLRLSKDNIDYYQQLSETSKDQGDLALAKDILSRAKAAMVKHEKEISYQHQVQQAKPQGVKDPVKARVYIITDEACRGACWQFVRELQAIPGTILIGKPTGIFNGDFMPQTQALKIGIVSIRYPIAQQEQPADHLGAPFLPAFRYHGFIGDTVALKQWVLKLNKIFKSNSGIIFR